MSDIVDRSAEQNTTIPEDLVKGEKASSRAVADDKFRQAIGKVMGIERQRQLLGMGDDGEGAKKSERGSIIHETSRSRLRCDQRPGRSDD